MIKGTSQNEEGEDLLSYMRRSDENELVAGMWWVGVAVRGTGEFSFVSTDVLDAKRS